mmetsp:Transcript_21488/g.51274  ORF Transcript_21488/g.51274 Transcript_21488/m.51274 type:complete len:268 (-) Transcript_21488:703-1506(-)
MAFGGDSLRLRLLSPPEDPRPAEPSKRAGRIAVGSVWPPLDAAATGGGCASAVLAGVCAPAAGAPSWPSVAALGPSGERPCSGSPLGDGGGLGGGPLPQGDAAASGGGPPSRAGRAPECLLAEEGCGEAAGATAEQDACATDSGSAPSAGPGPMPAAAPRCMLQLVGGPIGRKRGRDRGGVKAAASSCSCHRLCEGAGLAAPFGLESTPLSWSLTLRSAALRRVISPSSRRMRSTGAPSVPPAAAVSSVTKTSPPSGVLRRTDMLPS